MKKAVDTIVAILKPIKGSGDVGITIYPKRNGKPDEFCYTYIGFSTMALYAKGIDVPRGDVELKCITSFDEAKKVLAAVQKAGFEEFEISEVSIGRINLKAIKFYAE